MRVMLLHKLAEDIPEDYVPPQKLIVSCWTSPYNCSTLDPARPSRIHGAWRRPIPVSSGPTVEYHARRSTLRKALLHIGSTTHPIHRSVTMLLIREVFHCRPGKVRPLLEKFQAMNRIMANAGQGNMRLMTDFSGERYWTLIAEFETPGMAEFEKMMQGEGMSEADTKEFERLMEGYHDLIDSGHREIYRLEPATKG
ncbi:MAG TPA: hypothetical protein VGZ50_03105 [Actinomycetota bacterium]|nr:hypothetical protein [Actinomycetota bacterium]